MRIALYPNQDRDPGFGVTRRLIAHITRLGATAVIEEGIVPDLIEEGLTRDSYSSCELMICLGGDGTFLSAAHHESSKGLPKIGVNLGSVGFLQEIDPDRMGQAVESLIAGDFDIEARSLLESSCHDTGGLEIMMEEALNDVVIDKGAIGRLIEFELFIDGEFIFNLRSDGLIVSTPTGSTAYALSAGGPILHPTLTGIALVPLYPHALTYRPVTVNDTVEIELRITHADDPRVHFDGQVTQDLQVGDSVRIHRSDHAISFLHPPGYSYFSMLRQKLQWSERPKGS